MEIIERYISDCRKLAIVGGPNAGKTTFAVSLEFPEFYRPVFCTDIFMHLPWKDQPAAIIKYLADLDAFVIEGVQTARALRKGLEVDMVVFIRGTRIPLNSRQEIMRKTVVKVFDDWSETNTKVPTFYK